MTKLKLGEVLYEKKISNSIEQCWLNSERLRPSTVAVERTILEQAHSDRGRVVFSASFRRLAQKTQVFALSSDGARTRLTHSFEVAHIGVYIVSEIFSQIDKISGKRLSKSVGEWRSMSGDQRQAIRSFVEVACLLHDIGNPPFGHFGEKAICNWFKSQVQTDSFRSQLLKKLGNRKYDFLGFDGNKQGLRILTKLQRNNDDAYGLNLTCTQLASIIKYPKFSKSSPSKCRYFFSEEKIKESIWKILGLNPNQRHPLSLIMEAADDIAYCVSDLEDAAEKGLVLRQDLKQAFKDDSLDSGSLSRAITTARTKLTNELVVEVARLFIGRLNAQTEFNCESLLNSHERLDALREVVAKKVYSSREVLSNELTGYKVIHGILDAFLPLLRMDSRDFEVLANKFVGQNSVYDDGGASVVKKCTAEPSLLSLFPKKHLSTYLDASGCDMKLEMYHRIHLVIDFVAGMTDDFALDTYRLLSGQVIYGKS